MVRFDRRAGFWSCFLVIAAIAASPAAAQKPVTKPLGKPLPPLQPIDPPAVQPTILQPGVLTPAPAPQVKGWPHSIQTATETSCKREPLANEVIVYIHPAFAGSCAALTPGFYPHADNFLVGNDAISSIKVGSGVRARVFKDPIYAGDWNAYAPGTRSGGLGSFNDKITSIRVEPADRSQTCDDLRDGEVALYHHPNFAGDCVVLPGEGAYPNAESMGIRDDSISSIRNESSRRLESFWHPAFAMASLIVEAHARNAKLPGNGFMTNGIDDDISSIRMSQ